MNSKILTSPGVCVCIVENTAKVIQAGAWSELGKMLSSIEEKKLKWFWCRVFAVAVGNGNCSHFPKLSPSSSLVSLSFDSSRHLGSCPHVQPSAQLFPLILPGKTTLIEDDS